MSKSNQFLLKFIGLKDGDHDFEYDLDNKFFISYDYLDFNYKLLSWSRISSNPNAIELLKQNQNCIDWCILSSNPSIFIDEQIPNIL